MKQIILCLFILSFFACSKKNNEVGVNYDLEEASWNDSIFSIGNNNSIRLFHSDSTLIFYRNENNQINNMSDTFHTKSSYFEFKMIDIDFDNQNELVAYSFRNMNGNQFCEVFDFNSDFSEIVSKGNLFSGFYVDTLNQSIVAMHEGSWYMNMIYTKHKWCNDSLSVFEQLTVSNEGKDYEHQHEKTMIHQKKESCESENQMIYKKSFDSLYYNNTIRSFGFHKLQTI